MSVFNFIQKERQAYSPGLDFAHLMTTVATRIKKFMNLERRHLLLREDQENLRLRPLQTQRTPLFKRGSTQRLTTRCLASLPASLLVPQNLAYNAPLLIGLGSHFCTTLPFHLPEADCPILALSSVVVVTINFASMKPSIKVKTQHITYFGVWAP